MAISVPAINFPKLPKWLVQSQTANNNVLFDRGFVILAFTLYVIGLVMVASSSMPVAERLTGNPFYFVGRHASYIVICIVIAIGFLQVPMTVWQRFSFHFLGLALFLLIVVHFAGHSVNGAKRWLSIPGVMNIQAAEVAKLFFFCYVSSYLVRRRDEVLDSFWGFIKPIIIFGLLAFLLIMQPDLGTIVVMFVTTMGLLFLAGAKLKIFLGFSTVGVAGIVSAIYLEPYRWARVTGFLDPWDDPFGKGYQLTQSLMAYGRGEVFGQGLGNSIQKLEYLPEAHTDFVMAVIGEEFGFIGIFFVLSICVALVVKALLLGRVALEKEKYFEGFFAYAIGIWMSFQTAVNVGASAGIFPTKGLTMPLISYGGSSMIIMTLAIVILIRIDHELRLQAMQATQSTKTKKIKKESGGRS
ncbi:cell division protein FtsW [Thalassotalea crassostreae]|uniref:cell division protein FtsW n=1 Tax=Thalassotalea crassostreae TaxID=1763536 RepID=UPI000839AEE7|nr:cell division protein FtsW [Thalassotalea crassostreae]